MEEVKVLSFKEILKERLDKCESIDDKFICLIDVFTNQTALLDILLNSLSPKLQRSILKKAGFTEQTTN